MRHGEPVHKAEHHNVFDQSKIHTPLPSTWLNHELVLVDIPSMIARIELTFDFGAAPHSMGLNNPSCSQRHFGT